MSKIYKDAGVNIHAGYEVVDEIKKMLKKSGSKNDFANMGMFAGGFDLSKLKLKNPILFSATDGVGTKLLLAIQHNKIENLGQDLVAMCVNDLICHGAKPLYFLDYIAVHAIDVHQISLIIKSIIQTLNKFDCQLIGGETAEMKRVYQPKEFDLAGFAVGACEKELVLWNNITSKDDVVLGIESSGLHSNGYSLVHYLIEKKLINVNDKLADGTKIIDALLAPTNIYVNVIMELIAKIHVKGLANNTGGGVFENLARCLADTTDALIDIQAYPKSELFTYLLNKGNISPADAYNSLNMGIGFFVVVKKSDVAKAKIIFEKHKLKTYQIGKIIDGNKKVIVNW